MAELITEIISQEAFNQVKQMDANLAKLVKQFEDSARAAMLINEALKGSEGLGPLNDGLGGTTKAANNLEKAIKQLNVARSEEGKEIQRVRTETSLLNAETRKAEKDAIQSANAYKMLSLQHREATETAKKLGAQLGVTSKEFQTAAALANKYDQQLKAIDSGLGNYKRNVGNYASATMSLSQVLRELPAFTYSAQTGILGISNNLPILIDQFRALKAETGSSMSAMKIFANSLMSFPNILTIGIGLFTIFSDKIFGTGKAAKEADFYMNQLKDTLNELNSATTESNMYLDRQTKLLLAQAKARGASQVEILDIERKAIQERVKFLDIQISKQGEELGGLYRILSLKQAGSMAIQESEESIQKTIREGEKEHEKLIQQRSDAMIDAQIKSIEITSIEYKESKKSKVKQVEDTKKMVDEQIKQLQRLTSEGYGHGFAELNTGYEGESQIQKNMRLNAIKAMDSAQKVIDDYNNNPAKFTIKMGVDLWQLEKDLQFVQKAVGGAFEALDSLSQMQYENDIANIDSKRKKIEDQYELELRAIERSGKTATQIEKEKQQLEAKTAAQRKQNENERIQAAKRRAQFNKASDIAEIITSTALAVVSNLKESPVMAAIAAAIGAANLARAIATPLPSYEKGTQNHPGGFAQVSEAGQELVIQPDGKKYLTPKRKSIIHLPKGSKVIPNHELIKSAQNAAMIKLAGSGNVVTADSYGEALIDSFETKIEKLIKVTERKNTNVSVNLYGGFETYVKSNIR